jgi:TonB family protein
MPIPGQLLLSFFLLIPFTSRGQSDTIYYDQKWNRTEFNTAEYYRVTLHEADGKLKVEDHYRNNKLQMTGYYTSLETTGYDGIRDGQFVYYDKNGHKTSEGNFEQNKKAGTWKTYYTNSDSIWRIDHMKNGKHDGEMCFYYKSGKLKRRELHEMNGTTISGNCYNEEGREIAFTPFETMPSPTFTMAEFLATNLVYPEKARRKKIEGRSVIKFRVNEDGSISDVEATNHIGGGCDEEAVRVISAMPKWNPGIQDDKKVKVYFTLPIVFKLAD